MIYFKLICLSLIAIFVTSLVILFLYLLIKFTLEDVENYIRSNKKLRNKYYIKMNEVIKELVNKNIDISSLRYKGDLYVQHSYISDYFFGKINYNDYKDTFYCIEDNTLRSRILHSNIIYENVSIKRIDYKKMLKQLGVRV